MLENKDQTDKLLPLMKYANKSFVGFINCFAPEMVYAHPLNDTFYPFQSRCTFKGDNILPYFTCRIPVKRKSGGLRCIYTSKDNDLNDSKWWSVRVFSCFEAKLWQYNAANRIKTKQRHKFHCQINNVWRFSLSL